MTNLMCLAPKEGAATSLPRGADQSLVEDALRWLAEQPAIYLDTEIVLRARFTHPWRLTVFDGERGSSEVSVHNEANWSLVAATEEAAIVMPKSVLEECVLREGAPVRRR